MTFRKYLREITVDDLDLGFDDYIRSVRLEDGDDSIATPAGSGSTDRAREKPVKSRR